MWHKIPKLPALYTPGQKAPSLMYNTAEMAVLGQDQILCMKTVSI